MKSDPYIPYGRHFVSEEDIANVVEVLNSDWLTQGPDIEAFERQLADFCGARYAVAVANGTAALHLAALVTGLCAGRRLWTTPNTFVASANCALYCNAEVDFVDIDPYTYNISPSALEKKLNVAEKQGTLPDVVVVVHFAGLSANLEEIYKLSQKFGFRIIEDAAHAVGGSYKNTRIGSCDYSEMTIFSFHAVKVMTTGEGGAILTNSEKCYEKLKLIRAHGIVRDQEILARKDAPDWYYEQVELGYNYRISNIQVALGKGQLKRVQESIEYRERLSRRYDEALVGLPVQIPARLAYAHSAWHLYVIRLKMNRLSRSHREIFDNMRAAGIGVHLHYYPVYLQPYYQKMGFKPGLCPEAERYAEEALTLPLFYGMKDEDQDRVIDALYDNLT